MEIKEAVKQLQRRKTIPRYNSDYSAPDYYIIEKIRTNLSPNLTINEKEEGYIGVINFEHAGERYSAYKKRAKTNGTGINKMFNHPSYYDVYKHGDNVLWSPPRYRFKTIDVEK